MKRIVIAIALTILLTGCAARPASVDGNGTGASSASGSTASDNKESAAKTLDGEIKFYPTYDGSYKTGRNEMFDFWFDIPNDWKAADESKDGSEYTILPDNSKVEIKMYGIMEDGSEDEFYTKLAGNAGKLSDFTYRDGWVGKKIDISDTETYYVRVDGDSYMVLHINAAGQNEWMEQNKDKLNYIAMSERTTKESYGKSLDGKNSVTLDDLQLGNIKLDISYSELLKIMKQKPQKEETEEYDGLEAKTLFFADNTQIYVVDGAVYSLNVTDSRYETPRGLKVGDSRSKLIKLYGEPDNKEDANHWGYNYNGYEVFTVIVEDGKVTEIQVDLAM